MPVPRPRSAMRKIHEVIRLSLADGLSRRQVGAATGLPVHDRRRLPRPGPGEDGFTRATGPVTMTSGNAARRHGSHLKRRDQRPAEPPLYPRMDPEDPI